MIARHFIAFLRTKLVAPAAPSAVTITQDANANSFDVSFTDNSGGTASHEIEYEVDNSGTWETWGTVGVGVTTKLNQVVGVAYQDTLHNKAVSVRVKALGSPDSDWVEIVSPPTATFTAPSVPASFSISESGGGSVTGSYGNVTNETGFQIDYSWNSGSYISFELNVTDDLSITSHLPAVVAGANNTDTWRLRVRSSRYGALSAERLSNELILANQP